eukprot:CAMPEP_0178965684 /NCGR_PEP_ID=MMETSP0789-20121207/16463_1 /TAXON_ID=3005 /ORGANISM="Rhizosolenia setigera, Strain CCMP 1694" /LENGTH=1440 /DNA_ID=CAMNT_0020650785 /DNA_START=28 /DNA_END=4350 /DNA_ORIENTATION=-
MSHFLGCPVHDNTVPSTEEDSQSGSRPEIEDGKLTAREVVMHAEKINEELGHENKGFLSFSHGFAPRLTPITHFPPEFEAWNKLVDLLPSLLSSRKLRKYCDGMPTLDAKLLPPIFAIRAANVLGFTAHAYWNIGDAPTGRCIPASLENPWKVVNKFHLGRDGPPFLGFFEQIIANFQFENKVPLPSQDTKPCPWADENLASYGSVEYDVHQATISSFYPSLWLTRLKEERIFFGVMTEMHLAAAPVVKLVVEAQEAVLENDQLKLKALLVDLLAMLKHLTFNVFNKIQQQRMARHFNEGAIWCKVVAPVATPITSTTFGPSGTAAPLIHLLDAFFGRIKYEKFIGKEVRGLFHSFPVNWKNFLLAVWRGPSIREYVTNSSDLELHTLFGSCLSQYAGENGFLGRHKLKMVGYLEVAMKLGRAVTLGGFAGLLKDRTWDKIADELKVGQDERFSIPLSGSSRCSVGKVIGGYEDGAVRKNTAQTHHVRVDVSGTGIRYTPGSHVSILYESCPYEVEKTLLAFADGNIEEAKRLGNEYMVKLNSVWKKAIYNREIHHKDIGTDSCGIPTEINLNTFLKWGRLRPATQKMLRLAYSASHSKDIRSILNLHLEEALTFSDVVVLLKREGVNLLGNVPSSKARFSRIQGHLNSGRINPSHASTILEDFGLPQTELNRISIRSSSAISLQRKLNRTVKQTPDLCDIVEPCDFRRYSVASSQLVHPNELHLYIDRVQYEAKSAVAMTSPLLSSAVSMVRRRGAASDYIISKSLPRYVLAIECLSEIAGFKLKEDYTNKGDDVKFYLNEMKMELLKSRAHLIDNEVQAIDQRMKKAQETGDVSFNNIAKIIEEEVKDKPDPRDMSIVFTCEESPRFHLPSLNTPCIMIAGGTGLAPFRSFWQTLAMKGRLPNNDKHLLFVAQRTRETMSFEDEIFAMVKAGILDVEIIFSRDECAPDFSGNELVYNFEHGRKGYIDQLIEKKHMQQHLSYLIRDKGAHLYLCGRGAFAKTAVEALDRVLCNMFGKNQGEIELEKMVAEDRLVLDIFTSLNQPTVTDQWIELSELCQCNDFAEVRPLATNKERQLYIVINKEVYDMKKLFLLHPGGDVMLKLYCGMDATKAWKAVGHDKAPEAVAMLEIFDTKKVLRSLDFALDFDDLDWYKEGWREMTMTLVEMQNALSLAFHNNWDKGEFSSDEINLGEHYTVWRGKAMWRPKRSLLKGQYFIDTHDRLWSMFLPSLLSDPFDELSGNTKLGSDFFIRIEEKLESLVDSENHLICDAVSTIMKEELEKASEIPENKEVPSDLQAYMEEIRKVDEKLLEDIKLCLITGLQIFERNESPILPTFRRTMCDCIMGILEAVETYVNMVASLSKIAFDIEHISEFINRQNLKRGGMTLLHSNRLATVDRDYTDKDEASTKVLGGEVDVDHKVQNIEKCKYADTDDDPKLDN